MIQIKDLLIKINLELCNHCGACSYLCSTGTIKSVENDPTIIDLEHCSNCGLCEEICPTGAISLPFWIGLNPDPSDG